jgi:hypothetical protein
MALQYSVAVNNARLDAIETAIGATAILRIRSGAAPANCAAADSGTVLATLTLPADWMSAAAAGSKALHISEFMTVPARCVGYKALTARLALI